MVRFSVVITCYNQRTFIRAAVDSALTQLDRLREIIVVDDGSRDGSVELLEEYRETIELVRFPLNRGPIDARNEGAARAHGEYLAFLDGDDVLMPGALELYERVIMERRPKIILAQMCRFKGSVPPLEGPDRKDSGVQFVHYATLLAKDRPYGMSASALVVDRQAFWSAGGWSPGIFEMDLPDIGAKLGLVGPVVLICEPTTAWYRIHAANSILTVPPFLRNAHRLLRKERAGEYPGGADHRLERYAWLGGVIFFWIKRALKAGLYREATRLAVCGCPMVLVGAIRRSIAWVRGRRPIIRLGPTTEWQAVRQ